MTMKWRAWYADRRFDSSQHDWLALPKHGCLIVKWWPSAGPKHLECGADSIIRVGDEFVGVNLPRAEFLAVAESYAEQGLLKFGEYVDPALYEALYDEALAAEAPGA